MARLTATEKRRLALEQFERENQAAWTYLREEYHRRLFKLFAQSKEFNVRLTFAEESVTFEIEGYREYVLPSELPETRNDDVLDELNSVMCEFEDLRSQREVERRLALKQAALAKLSPEEREVLGL